MAAGPHTLTLAVRRSMAQSALLLAVLSVTFVVTGVITGLVGFLEVSATSAARAAVSGAAPQAAATRIEVGTGSDPDQQASAVEAMLDERFAGTSATVQRSLFSYPLTATIDGRDLTANTNPARFVPLADPMLAERAELVTGEWPDAGEAVLHAGAAEELGVAVGATIGLGDPESPITVRVSGTWRPLDPGAAYWAGAPGIESGQTAPASDGTPAYGPLVMDEATLLSIGVDSTSKWTITLDPGMLRTDQLDNLSAALTDLRAAVRELPAVGGSAQLYGSLRQTVEDIRAGLGATSGVTPIGVVLVSLIGLTTLIQLARLLSLARRPENSLLRSRGASAALLTGASLVEAVLVSVIGACLGVAASFLVLGAAVGATGPTADYGPIAALTAAMTSIVLSIVAWRDAVRITRRDTVDESGRARNAATAGAAVLAVAAASVATWQSLLYGSPLIPDAGGGLSVNPLAVLAPALGLIAGVLVFLVAVGPLSRATEHAASRRRPMQPSYSARQLARRLGSYAVALLVVALAAGGLTVTAAYAASWNALADRTAALAAGADVRVLASDGAALVQEAQAQEALVQELAGTPGVDLVVPGYSRSIDIGGGDEASYIAVPAEHVPRLMAVASDSIDLDAIAQALSGSARLMEDGFVADERNADRDAAPIGVVVSDPLAQHLALTAGDAVELNFGRFRLPATVALTVAVIPGSATEYSILADLNAFNSSLLHTQESVPPANELWLATSDPIDLAAISAITAGAEILTPSGVRQSEYPSSAETSLWLATVASIVLAAISLSAVALTVARARRGEVLVLRALGVPAATQARSRLVEMIVVVGVAIVGGMLAGAIVAALTVPGLASSVVIGAPESLPGLLRFSWQSGGVLLAVTAAVLIVIGVIHSFAVYRQAIDTDERPETG